MASCILSASSDRAGPGEMLARATASGSHSGLAITAMTGERA